jgi:hypothetical protein
LFPNSSGFSTIFCTDWLDPFLACVVLVVPAGNYLAKLNPYSIYEINRFRSWKTHQLQYCGDNRKKSVGSMGSYISGLERIEHFAHVEYAV